MRVFIDANIILRFYHFTEDDIEQLKILTKLHKEKKLELVTNDLLKDEVERNRDAKIKEAANAISANINLKLPKCVEHYKNKEKYLGLAKVISLIRKEFTNALREDAKNRSLPADNFIDELFSTSTHIEVREDLIQSAQLRTSLGHPPGKNGAIGDRIHWLTLLESSDLFDELAIISADKDFSSDLFEDQAHSFLLKEASKETFSEVYYYPSLAAFLKSHHPEIKLADDVERQSAVERLVHSVSFHRTHDAVEELEEFDVFYTTEVEQILSASIENPQIHLIISDPDIENFLERLIVSHRKHLPAELVENVEAELVLGGF